MDPKCSIHYKSIKPDDIACSDFELIGSGSMMEKQEKVFKYIEATWYDIHCKDKKEVKKIIREEILKNPDLEFKKLYLKCKRRCIAEL